MSEAEGKPAEDGRHGERIAKWLARGEVDEVPGKVIREQLGGEG